MSTQLVTDKKTFSNGFKQIPKAKTTQKPRDKQEVKMGKVDVNANAAGLICDRDFQKSVCWNIRAHS
ncbi:MAG: hypothetical protein R3D00_14490 [Bacteroidia bacterium]